MPIFLFDMGTPLRRNSSDRARVTASAQEVVNSVTGDPPEDASPQTPRVVAQTSASHCSSPDGNHNEMRGNLSKPGYVIMDVCYGAICRVRQGFISL